jgi:hypothetical protein
MNTTEFRPNWNNRSLLKRCLRGAEKTRVRAAIEDQYGLPEGSLDPIYPPSKPGGQNVYMKRFPHSFGQIAYRRQQVTNAAVKAK